MPHRVWDFPVMQGTIRNAKRPSRRLRARRRRFRRARRPRRAARSGSGHRGTARSRAATSCSTSRAARRSFPRTSCATAISGPIRGDRAAVAEARLEGGRPGRRVRQAALHRFLRRSLRPFALAHRRLHALPRSLPDRRDRAGGRPRRDRRRDLRRLRQLRRRLPDRCRRLRGPQRPRRCCGGSARCSCAYRQAGGATRSCCSTTLGHGEPLIDALARFGAGLPANVLPVAVNEMTQLGVEAWTAPFAWGAAAVRALGPRPAEARHAGPCPQTSPSPTS